MCSPVGHTFLGYSVSLDSSVFVKWRKWWIIILIIFMSNLPDIDFCFGYLKGDPNLYHHQWTHSLTFVFAVALLFGLGYRLFTRKPGLKVGCIVAVILISHLLLDIFCKDTRVPYGIQLFWPMSQKFFISPMTFLRDVSKASSNRAFLSSLFCWHNFWTVMTEVAVLGPILLSVWVWRRKKRSGEQ